MIQDLLQRIGAGPSLPKKLLVNGLFWMNMTLPRMFDQTRFMTRSCNGQDGWLWMAASLPSPVSHGYKISTETVGHFLPWYVGQLAPWHKLGNHHLQFVWLSLDNICPRTHAQHKPPVSYSNIIRLIVSFRYPGAWNCGKMIVLPSI